MDSFDAHSLDIARYVSSLHRESDISHFAQIEGESFFDLGGDFTYIVGCRPHTYTLDDLFFIFFGGLREEMKDFMQMLDGGAVFEMTPEEAWERLESMRQDIDIMDGTPGGLYMPSEEGICLRTLDHGELDGHLRSMGEMIQQSAQLLLTQRQQVADLALLTASFGSGIPPHSSFSLFDVVPFPLAGDVSELCPEVIDTYF